MERPSISARSFAAWLGAHVLALAILSVVVIVRGASDEPYLAFRAVDALTQIGAASVLMVGWVYLTTGVAYGLLSRRLARGWMWLVPVAAIFVSYLSLCPSGFVDDIERAGRHGSSARAG